MDEQPVRSGEMSQTSPGVAIVDSFGDVDVDTDTEVGGQTRGRFESVVGARESGVHSDHASSAGSQEALVLGEPSSGSVRSVAIGHSVGAGDPYSDLGAGIVHEIEAEEGTGGDACRTGA